MNPTSKPIFSGMPLATIKRRGLLVDIPFLRKGDTRDYAGNIPLFEQTLLLNTGGWSVNQAGAMLETSGSNNSYLYMNLPNSFDAYPFTLFAAGLVTTLSGDCLNITLAFDGESTQSAGLSFNDGVVQGFIYSASFNSFAQASGTVSAGDYVSIAFVVASDTDRRLYLNGKLVATDATDSDDFPSGSGNWTLGIGTLNRSSPSFFPGEFSMARVYTRELLESELLTITNDPWADYRQSDEILWAGTAIGSGASGFNSAFAYSSNQIL